MMTPREPKKDQWYSYSIISVAPVQEIEGPQLEGKYYKTLCLSYSHVSYLFPVASLLDSSSQ